MLHDINDHREWYRTIYLKSDHWKQLKAAKLKECPQCKCGSTSHLDVHHVNYRQIFDVDLSDLVVLCRKHHKEEHDRLDSLKPPCETKPLKRKPFTKSSASRWTQKSRRYWHQNKQINAIRSRILKRFNGHES